MRTNKDEGEEETKRWTKKFKNIYIYTFHANSNSSATISILQTEHRL